MDRGKLTTGKLTREATTLKRCLISNEIRKTGTKLESTLSLFQEYLPEDLHDMLDETDSSSEDDYDSETTCDDELSDEESVEL